METGKTSLGNIDGDENGNKQIGNNNVARASHFFAHFFAVEARLQRGSD